MAGKIETGGAAFPANFSTYDHYGRETIHVRSGMSLREWLAGQALAGLTTANPSAHLGITEGYAKHVAEACFALADAMIAAGKAGA